MGKKGQVVREDLTREEQRAWDAFKALMQAAGRYNTALQAMTSWRQMVGYWGGLLQRFRDHTTEKKYFNHFAGLLTTILGELRADMQTSLGPKISELKAAIEAI